MISNGDFRQILISEYEKRATKNPTYSLRAFARDIALSPAHLSQVVRGNEGLSRASAERAARVLFQDASDIENFCKSVESQHGRSQVSREAARLTLIEQWKRRKKELTENDFAEVMDWYHLAILHLTDLENFQAQSTWIAEYLGIEVAVVDQAIENLLKLDLLELSSSGIKRKQGAFINSQSVPRPVIREHHRQILTKAIESIEGQTIDQRFLSSITFGASKENLVEMRDAIKRFIAEIERISLKSEGDGGKSELACVSVQLFDLQSPFPC